MSGRMGWLFGILQLGADTQPLTPMDNLKEALEMLEKMEKDFAEKASEEVEKVKEFLKARDRRAAIRCLKKKKLYEKQIEQLGNYQLQILDRMIELEGARAAIETVDALRTGATAVEAMNVDAVYDIMDEINEQHETMEQIQEAVSAPCGAAAFIDEDELEAELERLNAELEEHVVPPTETASAAPFPVPDGLLRGLRVPQGTAMEDDPEGAELEEQLPPLASAAVVVQVIVGLLPVPPFLRRQLRRMNFPMRWHFEQVVDNL